MFWIQFLGGGEGSMTTPDFYRYVVIKETSVAYVEAGLAGIHLLR